jgi:hypothetical protein
MMKMEPPPRLETPEQIKVAALSCKQQTTNQTPNNQTTNNKETNRVNEVDIFRTLRVILRMVSYVMHCLLELPHVSHVLGGLGIEVDGDLNELGDFSPVISN